MEEIIGFMGRAVGVSLGVGAIKAVSGGLRPILRDVVRAGVVVGEGVQAVAAGTLGLVAGAVIEANQEISKDRTPSRRREGTRKRGTETRQIAIVKD
jgi:hypothetical protein